jgi:DNA polymerase (family 10)
MSWRKPTPKQSRLLREYAQRTSLHTVATVKRDRKYFRIEIAGDFRRGCELVTDIALVAQTRTTSPGDESAGGLKLAMTDKKHFGASLLHATGPAGHIEQLAQLARDNGFELKPDGLYRRKTLVASATENDPYEALDLQFIEPELREGRDENRTGSKTQAAETCPRRGSARHLHCHTTASDGIETLESMAEATRERGFERRGSFAVSALCRRLVPRRDY